RKIERDAKKEYFTSEDSSKNEVRLGNKKLVEKILLEKNEYKRIKRRKLLIQDNEERNRKVKKKAQDRKKKNNERQCFTRLTWLLSDQPCKEKDNNRQSDISMQELVNEFLTDSLE
ncbi:13535_t:CDS:2, partial [Gigaspora margarita]